MKNCIICGISFSKAGNWKTCSKKCSKENIRLNDLKRNLTNERKKWTQEYDRKRYLKNSEKIKKRVSKYVKENKDKINLYYRTQRKEYRKMNTYVWKFVRQDVFERDNFCCIECGETKKLVIHHLRYNQKYHQLKYRKRLMKDLVTLCRDCHRKKHKKKFEKFCGE